MLYKQSNLARIRQVRIRCDLLGCSVQIDLILGRGQESPENHPLIVEVDFFYRFVGRKDEKENES